MTTKLLIPEETLANFHGKLKEITSAKTHDHSAAFKIAELNRVIRGWSGYYQYASNASRIFHQLEHKTFWYLAHWLGRKFQISMPQVMKRYAHNKTFVVGNSQLTKASALKSKRYTERFLKPNPYLTEKGKLPREDLPDSPFQVRYENRPGWMDLRSKVLERDGYTCRTCGQTGLTSHTAEVDHKKPMRRFKLAVNANRMDNLQTLCIPCHKEKTKVELQVESPVQ